MNFSRELSEIETLELIKFIQEKNKYAESAFIEFCFRFEEPLKKIVERSAKGFGLSREDAIQILEKTFLRFWKYPKFDPLKVKVSHIDNGIILYLARIASRTLIDEIKLKNGAFITPYTGDEQIIYDFPKNIDSRLLDSDDFQILSSVLSRFSWKHKIIYLTYSTYEEAGFNLPRKLLAELRKTLALDQDTIRYYKYEVLQKIAEYKELWQKRRNI